MPVPRRGASLPRLWIDSSFISYSTYVDSPASGRPSAAISDLTMTDTPSPYSAGVLHVICLYDFDAEDSNQLSFLQNEILEIVKQEETGWWAALRPGDKRVGWVPSAFVAPISEGECRQHRGSNEVPAGRRGHLLSPLSVPSTKHPRVVTPDGEFRGFEWMPMLEHEKTPDSLFPGFKDGAATFLSPIVPPHEGVDDINAEFDAEVFMNETTSSNHPHPPPSPSTQVPQHISRYALRSPKSPQKHFSTPVIREPNTSEHARSYSDLMAVASARRTRPRPVLVDDRPSLNHLTTLFETNNVEELENIISSPVVVGTFDGVSRATGTPAKREEPVASSSSAGPTQSLHVVGPSQTPASPELRFTRIEDEIRVLADGSVGAGSLRALLERLVADGSDSAHTMKFRRVFLSTFKTFASADELFIFLSSKYHSGSSTTPISKGMAMQRRILTIFSMWSGEYEMLHDDPYISRRLIDFLSSIRGPSPLTGTVQAMLRSLEHSTSIMFSAPISVLTRKQKKSKSLKLDLLRVHPSLMAEQLSLYEHRFYSKVRFSECVQWAKTRTGESVANLAAFCATHEKLVTWIHTTILTPEAMAKRCEALRFWIAVAEKCLPLSNFSTIGAIVAALSDHTRLHLVWAHVPLWSHFESISLMVEPERNYFVYRQRQLTLNGPCVPLVEMYLLDIVRTHAQHTDYTLVPALDADSVVSLINFTMLESWHDAAEALLRHQNTAYAFPEDPNVMGFIEISLAAAGCSQEKEQTLLSLKEVPQPDADVSSLRKALELTRV